jgi:predicted transposase YbfD/YdcC
MRLVLGQCTTHEKSNEISAIPELLRMMKLKDTVVTIDAMGCQKEIASDICEAGGHYILALKGNQKKLHADVVDYFADDGLTKDLTILTDMNKDHGRIEERSIRQSSDIVWLRDLHQGWSNLNTIIEISSKRTLKEVTTTEKWYYITDLNGETLENLLNYIRSHWAIENSLHWVLDVVFKEDYNQCRIKNEAQNLAILRHTCLNLIRNNKSPKTSIKLTRKKASWNTNTLRQLLNF